MKKAKFKKKLWVMMMGIGVILGSMQNPGIMGEVNAAQEPVITDLRVTALEDNTHIAAQCNYQNYGEQSGCVLTLYLYQVKTDKEASIAAYKSISHAETGEDSTDPVLAVDGIYLASVGMDYDGVIKQINSEHYYRVKCSDGKIEMTEMTEPEQKVNEERGYTKDKHACPHDNLDYELVQPATAESDSVLAYKCTLCGEVIGYEEVPNSAYAAFLQEAADRIRNARTEEVIISTERWVSFHKTVTAQITGRPDVAVTIRYKYQGERYEVTIPAGADVNALVDENGFCGFRYLDQIFDGNQL